MIRITIEIDNEGVNITREDIGKKKAEKVLLEVQRKACVKLNEECDIDNPKNYIKKSIITKKKKVCRKCGKIFQPEGNRQRYCSEACGMKRKVYVKKREKIVEKLEPEIKLESIFKPKLITAIIEKNFIHKGNTYNVIESNKDSYLIKDDMDMEVWYDKSLFE